MFESLVSHHIVLNGSQDILESSRLLPVLKQGEVLHSSVTLVHTGNVAFIIEFDNGTLDGVVGTALDVQTVNPVFEVSLN